MNIEQITSKLQDLKENELSQKTDGVTSLIVALEKTVEDLLLSFILNDQALLANEGVEQLPVDTELDNNYFKLLMSHSLLSNLMALPHNSFGLTIIQAIINRCPNLSQRHDLVLLMIDQKTVGVEDMTAVFDLLVEKGLPQPPFWQMERLLNDPRSSSGQNATKLAISFFNKRNDDRLLKWLSDQLSSPLASGNSADSLVTKTTNRVRRSPSEFAGIMSRHKEKEVLIHFLMACDNKEMFVRKLKTIIVINNDELLRKFMKKHVRHYLNDIEDHTLILNQASDAKLTETFEILVNAGFNPLKSNNNPNSFAFACMDQGPFPLACYLASIKKKFGESIAEELINKKDCLDKTALSYAIEGRGYIDTIKFLENNGADFSINQLEHVKIAAKKNHAGVFDLLLNQHEVTASDLSSITDFVANHGSYIINCVLLEYLKARLNPKDSLSQNEQGSVDKSPSNLVENLKDKLLININEKLLTLKEDDIFELCKVNGDKAFGYFMKEMQKRPGYNLQHEVNRMDVHFKAPLYYAIANNAYDSLVKALLENGANPNLIGYSEETNQSQPMNAVVFTIIKNEPSTLKLILEANNLTEETIAQGCDEILKLEHHNALLIKYFIEGLHTSGRLSNSSSPAKCGLLQRSLSLKAEDAAYCIALLRQSITDEEFDLNQLINTALEESDSYLLQGIMNNFYSSGSAYPIETSISLPKRNQGSDRSSLTFFAPQGRLHRQEGVASLDDDYLDFALSQANQALIEQSERLENAKQTVKLLLEHGFKSGYADQELKNQLNYLSIEYDEQYPPPQKNSCRVM